MLFLEHHKSGIDLTTEQSRQKWLDGIIERLGGIWDLTDLGAPEDLIIPSFELLEGKLGITTVVPIPDHYLPKELSAYINKYHDIATLKHLSDIIRVHIRSRFAQLGLDGELVAFNWENERLTVTLRLYSRSSRSTIIKSEEKFSTLFTTVGSRLVKFDQVNHEGCLTNNELIICATGARASYDYGILSVEKLEQLLPSTDIGLDKQTVLAYVRISPDWQVISQNTELIRFPEGPHSNEFRKIIDAQLENFNEGETSLLIGETIPKLKFKGPALLRSEIIGLHKTTDEVFLLKQTNSPYMGPTKWSIRVEVTTVDGQPISAEKLKEYDFYLILEFVETKPKNLTQYRNIFRRPRPRLRRDDLRS